MVTQKKACVVGALGIYTALQEFSSRDSLLAPRKTRHVIVGVLGSGGACRVAHGNEEDSRVCSITQNCHRQMLLLHFG